METMRLPEELRSAEAKIAAAWWHTFVEAIKMPSGLCPHVDPTFVGERVTEFLVSLQRMNADAFEAGLKQENKGGSK